MKKHELAAALAFTVLAFAPSARGGPPDPPAAVELELGRSVADRPIVARAWGSGPDTALVIASIHGSEPAGTPLVERFEQWLAEHPDALAGRRLVVVPIANPDGYANRERFNSNGVDLNRNFPADNRTEHRRHGPTALSEPESAGLMRLLRTHPPQRVLSIHQPIACVDYDGPAEALANTISTAIAGRLPVKQIGSRPGSLGSYVGVTLGVPIITLELPEHAEDDPEKLWRDYRGALEAFVKGAAP
ncbi:murein peptide amidase A [Pirellulimonas nuda]|uniref:Murein peptide amidase A n=1 Tax=Pirellulimonas nuda TaxID=2528009 RepID=A0A518DGS6_9BACT|nr:DUF2817 domain-containing protein [Pirellulimonas nuda]QDU90676.1 murein peptide amidase A [Pirellulimonas nuda]